MNPAKLCKLGSRTEVTWVNWVLEHSESSSMGCVALPTNIANPAKTWRFFIESSYKLGKAGSRTQQICVTSSLGLPR